MREGKRWWKIEAIEIHWLPFEQVLDWCRDGTITDAET